MRSPVVEAVKKEQDDALKSWAAAITGASFTTKAEAHGKFHLAVSTLKRYLDPKELRIYQYLVGYMLGSGIVADLGNALEDNVEEAVDRWRVNNHSPEEEAEELMEHRLIGESFLQSDSERLLALLDVHWTWAHASSSQILSMRLRGS